MAFDLSDYKTVDERIAELKEKHPDAVLQSRIVDIAIPGFIAVEARCYRNPGDEIPGIGLAWEPVPGRTPYTKDSELQNAETSAWGRAIVAALVSDTSKGIASANEVQNRVEGQQSSQGRSAPKPTSQDAAPHRCPACSGKLWDNRTENVHREAQGKNRMPAFKCKNDPHCAWISWDEFEFDPQPIREDGTPVGSDYDQPELDDQRPF